MKMKHKIAFLLFLIVGVFVLSESVQALRITLKRVVFEGPKRAEMLTIINSSDKEETYRLGWRHFRMTADKSLVAVPDDQLTPDIKPVVDMIRFAPRRFTVPPRSSQRIRMMLRMPADLPDGEYRSHFWVRPEADVEVLRLEAEKDVKAKGAKGGVSLTMLAGVTMPIIVRKGDLEASVSIQNLQASESSGFVTVSFSLIREGNKSVYGDLEYICNAGAGEYLLKRTKGIAVYTELNQRNFNLRIEKNPDNPGCNSLAITYSLTNEFNGKDHELAAEAKVQVN